MTARLILLPGLGADARLFAPQAAAFKQLEVPEWLAPRRGESLEDFGRRMATPVVDGGAVAGREELILGGVSFGGMVACEMARHLRASAILLIASATTGAAIPPHGRLLAAVAARVPPFRPPPG